MKLLGIFLLGFCFTYFINVLDLYSKLFEAKIALKITKINSQIGEWGHHDMYSNDYEISGVYSDMCDDDEDEWED